MGILFNWRQKSLRQQIILVLTLVVVVVLASHPELRLFLPLVDALGLDLLLLLIGAQFLDYARPIFFELNRLVLAPLASKFYSFAIFSFGIMGPYVDARISTCRHTRRAAG